MKATNTILKLATLASVLVLLQGCASAPMETEVIAPSTHSDVVETLHRVRPHERLGDIALRYTGDATNWERIARYNGISNARHLRIGAMIAIPNSLLLPQGSQAQTTAAKKKDLQLVAASRPNATTTTTNTLAVKRGSVEKSPDAVLEPVVTNRAFKLSPIKDSTPTSQTQNKRPALKVQIVGTYYPKGIYRQPANYSTLVMRAAPGTLFDVEYLANDWYKIITENGIGYLRADDGKVVSVSAQP
ncbi:LysM peptidoglycan-binding domain-containing protein [Granulosicoccus sp.]|nr:LysM domain-containing protein [Granulosicoccus sp.]MDB4224062.1 LysM peptidoglycan-binding domain-containing protein [Granulosicoccus sp.]